MELCNVKARDIVMTSRHELISFCKSASLGSIPWPISFNQPNDDTALQCFKMLTQPCPTAIENYRLELSGHIFPKAYDAASAIAEKGLRVLKMVTVRTVMA